MKDNNETMEQRLAVARISYGEVLDATKHNDEKIGRALTSIAFITTAGVAFAVGGNEHVLKIRYIMGRASAPLPSIFLLAFFVFILLTVIMYLSAMGNPLTFPEKHDEKIGSNLFFYLIANEDRSSWTETWGLDARASYDTIRLGTINNFVNEAHHLAGRVRFKYERMEIARALFITALISLILSFVTGLTPFIMSTASQQLDTLRWGLHARIYLAVAVGLLDVSLTFDAYVNAIFKNKMDSKLAKLHLLAVTALPIFSLSMLMISASDKLLIANLVWIFLAALCSYVSGASLVKIASASLVKTASGSLVKMVSPNLGYKRFIAPGITIAITGLLLLLVVLHRTEICDIVALSLALVPVTITPINAARSVLKLWRDRLRIDLESHPLDGQS